MRRSHVTAPLGSRRKAAGEGRGGLKTIRVVRPFPAAQPACGALLAGLARIPCALGRSGARRRKREGDGATPIGDFRIVGGYARLDRVRRFMHLQPVVPTRADDGWCDDPGSFLYNQPIRLPAAQRAERLCLDAHIYDLVLVLDHNLRPKVRGAGSAIFFHLARHDRGPTEGCVAISMADMRRLLPRLARGARIRIT
jgi:L,D-peptidoglycan transpeptidase YkuD (ErfK/YbiS/YcfS/YnhG family)